MAKKKTTKRAPKRAATKKTAKKANKKKVMKKQAKKKATKISTKKSAKKKATKKAVKNKVAKKSSKKKTAKKKLNKKAKKTAKKTVKKKLKKTVSKKTAKKILKKATKKKASKKSKGKKKAIRKATKKKPIKRAAKKKAIKTAPKKISLSKYGVVSKDTGKIIDGLTAHKYKFENGLTLIYVPRRLAPLFSYQTWYNVGARDEDINYTGMAHFFEHLMFKSLKNRKPGEFDQIMESRGARDLNAFTSSDFTAYVQSLPVEAFETVAQLESERMTSLMLSKAEIDSEREVVHNERKERSENSPEGVMFDRLLSLSFQKHAYRWPVIGYKEDLDRMEMKDLLAFYDRYYAPNNAVIVIVGDLSEEKVLKVIQKKYGNIPASDIRFNEQVEEPEQKEERRDELSLDLMVPKVYFGYKIPSAGHPDVLRLGLLCSYLSSGRSSKLYRSMVDAGISVDASAATGESKDTALLYMTVTAQMGKTADDVVAGIDQAIEDLFENGINEQELNRAKNKTKVDFFQAFKTNSSIANFIGHSEILYKDYRQEIREFDEIDGITTDELQAVAKKYLRNTNRNIVIGVPKEIEASA